MISNIEVAMVTWPTPVLIGVLLLVLLIGALIGNFTSGVESKKKLEEAHARIETVIQQARSDAERAAARVAQAEKMIASAPGNSQPGKTFLRLWLDSAERPALDLDGQRVDTTRISEPHRKRLVSLLSVMRPWIEGKPSASAPILAPPTPVPPPAPKSIFSLFPAPSLLPAKKVELPAALPSMVAQIDEILQARLAIGPLAERGIKLQESPEGAVIVMVDAQKFEGVGEVTDPEVQSVIRAAIAEWEQKYTPGR
ncbi:MAG: hypothetical protein A3K41_17560 [Chloroflexi bacterium RIFOXYD12_FULL_57_15]|nr:MAG: hypothetical protein A3K41_17560 [Chloroflexi bacterium RIFOXYD12_FULL_57_15]